MYGFRVTKYDPARRDERGAFLDPDWTSHADVDRVVGGRTLLLADYLEVESAYAAAARAFFQEARCPSLTVVDLESHEPQPRTIELGLTDVLEPVVQDGDRIGDTEIERLCRLNLRELVWCKLEAESKAFYLHFGYDYYMYVGTQAPSEDVIRRVEASGLFVEPMRSPYLDEEPE
jgi:hypothetical protein